MNSWNGKGVLDITLLLIAEYLEEPVNPTFIYKLWVSGIHGFQLDGNLLTIGNVKTKVYITKRSCANFPYELPFLCNDKIIAIRRTQELHYAISSKVKGLNMR